MKKISTILLSFFACFCVMFASACSLNKSKGKFSEEIIVSVDETIDIFNYLTLENIKEKDVVIKFSDSSIVEENDGEFKAKKSGESYVYAVYKKKTLATTTLIVKPNYSSPINLRVNDSGLVEWNKVYGIYDGEEYYSNYKIKISYNGADFKEYDCDTNSYQLDDSKKGKYVVAVKALGTKYFDESEYCDSITFNYLAMKKLTASELSWQNGTNTLSWNEVENAKYKIKVNGVLYDSENFLNENSKILNFNDIEAGETIKVSVVVYDDSDNEYLETESESISLTKLGKTIPTYNATGQNKGTISWTNVDNISHYAIQFTSLTGKDDNNKIIKSQNLSSSFDEVNPDIYKVSITAVNDTSNEYFINGDTVTLEENVAKLDSFVLKPYGEGENYLQLEVALQNSYFANIYSICTNKKTNENLYLNSDLINAGEDGNFKYLINLNLENAGVYDVISYAMPSLGENEKVTPYVLSGVTAKYVLRSNVSNSQTVYKLHDFIEEETFGYETLIHYVLENGNSSLNFYEIENAKKVEVTINENVYKFDLEKDSQIQLQEGIISIDLGFYLPSAIEPVTLGEDKIYNISVRAYRDDKVTISSKTTKTITMLKVTDYATTNSGSKVLEFGNVENADSYDVFIYKITASMYKDFKESNPIDVASITPTKVSTTSNSVRNLTYGYYLFRIYSKNNMQNDYLNSKDYAEFVDYVTENLVAPTVDFGYDEDNYSFAESLSGYYLNLNKKNIRNVENDETDNYLIQYIIKVYTNNMSDVVEETTIERTSDVVKYKFKTSFDNQNTTYCIKVMTTAMNSSEDLILAEANILDYSDVASVNVKRINTPTTSELTVEEDELDIQTFVDGVSKIYLSNNKETKTYEDDKATYSLNEFDGKFNINIKYIGNPQNEETKIFEVEGNETIYLDSEMETFTFVRSATPIDLKYEYGKVNFVHKDNGDIKAYNDFYRIVFIFTDEKSNNYEFDIDLNLQSNSLNIDANYAGSNIENILLTVEEDEFAEILVENNDEKTIDIQKLIDILLERLNVTISNNTENIFANSYQQADEFTINLYSYNATYNNEDNVFTTSSRLAKTYDDGDSSDLKIEKMATPTLRFKEEDSENYYFTITFEEDILGTTYEAYYLVDGEENVLDTYSVDVIRVSKNLLDVSKQYYIYARAQHKNYFDSNNSKEIGLYRLSAIKQLTLKDGNDQYAKIQYVIPDLNYVSYVDINGTNNGTNLTYEITSDGMYNIKLIGKNYVQDEITYYVANSDTYSIKMTKMVGTNQTIEISNNEISFTRLSYLNISYFVIFEYTIDTQKQYHIINIEENTKLNLLTYAESLANNISVGDVKFYIYGTITNTIINLEIDEERNYNDAITAENGEKYYNTVKIGEGSTKKLVSPNIKSIEFITDSSNEDKINAIQTSKVKLTWEGNYGTDSTFEIKLNDEVVSPETYVITNESDGKYSAIITNDIFESYEYGKNILKLKVISTTAINSTPTTAYIYRFTSPENVTLSADRILTIKTLEYFSEEQEFMIGLSYVANDETTTTTYFTKKFGTQSNTNLEENTGTFKYDISKEIYSVSNGKAGKLKISVILNNLSISNYGHTYYMGALNEFTIDEGTNILGTIDETNIEINSHEISILDGNFGEIYIFSVKGTSDETKNFSLNDVEFDYSNFNYELTEAWINGSYQISIYSRQDEFISSIPFVYDFTLQRLKPIEEVLFNRETNTETNAEEIKVYWALDTTASGYYVEVYETSDSVDEDNINYSQFSKMIGNYSLDMSELGFSMALIKLTPYYKEIDGKGYFTLSFNEIQERCSINLTKGYYLFKIKSLGSVAKSESNYSKLNSHIYNFVVYVPENTVSNISVSTNNYRDLVWNGQKGVAYYIEIDGNQYLEASGTSLDVTNFTNFDDETLENPGGKVIPVSINVKGNLTSEKFSTETGIVYMDSEKFSSYIYKISGIKTIEETEYDSANSEIYIEGGESGGSEGGTTEEPTVDPENPEDPSIDPGLGDIIDDIIEKPDPIIESGYLKISLYPNNTEIDLEEIKFYAGIYDTEENVLKNSIEFTPIRVENVEEFPYVVRLEELISLLNVSPTKKGENILQTISIWIVYENEIQANDPNFDTFRSYCLRSNLYQYSFIYEKDEYSTSGDNEVIKSLYEYYEWTDENTNIGNYAEKYFVTPINQSENEELIGFWARIKYKEVVDDGKGGTEEIEQVKYTYIDKEDCVNGYMIIKDGKKFFSKKDESGKTDGLLTGESSETSSESPTSNYSCYGINLDKILEGLDEGYYTVSISKYCNYTVGTNKYQKQYSWIGNESFNKLPSVQSVYMSKGIIYWNDSSIDKTNIDYYYLYFYPTEEKLNTKLKILPSTVNYFDPSNYILNDQTKYNIAVISVSTKSKYAPSNKVYVTNSNGLKVDVIKNLIDTTNIMKVDDKGSIYFDWSGTDFYRDINTLRSKSGDEASDYFNKMLEKVYYSPIAFTINNLIESNYYNIQFKFEATNTDGEVDTSQKPYYATVDFSKLLKQEFDIDELSKYVGLSEDPSANEKFMSLVSILSNGGGVANEKTLFDEFANNVPHGEYTISYRVLGTSSTISSTYCKIVTLNEGESASDEGNFKYDKYYVVNAPIIKTRLLSTDDGKVYAFMFKQIELPTYNSETKTYESKYATSYVIHMNSKNFYVNLKSGEEKKWQCQYGGKSFDVLTCSETGMIADDGTYILVYVNYLADSLVEKFELEKQQYSTSVFVVGNGYCLGSKSDNISIKLQSFGDNFTIIDGQFVWDTDGFDTKVVISRGEETPPEEVVSVDSNGETSTFNLDNYPAVTYDYICFFVEGTRTSNSLVVDSEKYYVYNVVKLSTPTLSTYEGKIYIDDQSNSGSISGAGWDATVTKYIYNIYNDVSKEEINMNIESNSYTNTYEPGMLDINEDDEDYATVVEYKGTERNAKQYFIRNNGTASATIKPTKKTDGNGRSYYDFTEKDGKYKDESWTIEQVEEAKEKNNGEDPGDWNGLLFSTNANYIIIRSSVATLNAQMAKTITEIKIDENGDLTWDPVLKNDSGKEIYDENVVYKIIVANKVTSAGADGEQADLAPSSQIETFYTKLNTFNVTKIAYGNGQGDDETGEDLFKDFEKDLFLNISIQVLSLQNYDDSMLGQYKKVALVEGGYVVATPVGGNLQGFIYKDSQDFVLLSERCSNENAKFIRVRPIEDDRLEILNETLYNGNSDEVIAEAGDLHWSFMALEMGEILDYYTFVIEVINNNKITYATGKFIAIPDIDKTKELKANEYANAESNVRSNLRYFDIYFAFDDGILVGGNTYNINIYAHYKVDDINPHIRSFGKTITSVTKPITVTANHISISTKAEDNETYEEFSLQTYLGRAVGSIGGYNYIIRMYYRFKDQEFSTTRFVDFSTTKPTIKVTNDVNIEDGYNELTRTVNITSDQMEYYFYVIPNENSTNILRSDKSETFYLQRPDWGEGDKIIWDDVTKSFSWDYTGVHSLIGETQLYKLDGDVITEVTEEIVNADGEYETVGVKIGLDALVKLGNPYIGTDNVEYVEITIDGDETEEVYYIVKSQVSNPTYVITASYYNKNNFTSLTEQRVYQSASNKFIPEIVGYTSISVTVRLGASNIESVNKYYEIEITEEDPESHEVVVIGTEIGYVNNNIFTSGEGSELNPYIISTKEDFNNIRYRMNKESYLNNYNLVTYDENDEKTITTVSAGTKFYFKQINNIIIEGGNGVYFAQTSFSGDYTAASNGGNPYRINYTTQGISALSKSYTWDNGMITSSDGGNSKIEYSYGISIFEELAVSANIHDVEVNISISNQTVNKNVLIAGLAIENKGIVANFTLNTMSSLLKTEANSSAVIVYSGIVSYNNTGTLRNVKNNASMDLSVTQSNTYLFASGITFMNSNGKIYDSINNGNISVTFTNGNSTVLVAGLVVNNYMGIVSNEADGTGCINNGILKVESNAKGSTTAYVAGGICWSRAIASGTVNVANTGSIEIGGNVQNQKQNETILTTV